MARQQPDECHIHTHVYLPEDPLHTGLAVALHKCGEQFYFRSLMAAELANSGPLCAQAKPSSATAELAAVVWVLIWATADLDGIPLVIFTGPLTALGLTE